MQTISGLSFVSCVAVGDILNKNRNSLIIVTADGWCYIYEESENCTSNCEEFERTEEVFLI